MLGADHLQLVWEESLHVCVHVHYITFGSVTASREAPPTPDQDLVEDWPVYVLLTNGKTYGCDLVVSATGVLPNSDVIKINDKGDKDTELKLSVEDGRGIVVDSQMRSSLRDVYAAGDVCAVQWTEQAPLWFQVRGAYDKPQRIIRPGIKLRTCIPLYAPV